MAITVPLVTGLLCFAVMEAGLSFVYRPLFDLAKLERLSDKEFTPSLNADGFREEPVPDAVLGPDTVRVLFLGDSFTFGHGVRDGAARFSDLIEARLNSDGEGKRYHIYNAGVRGTEPTRWVGHLRSLFPKYRPDVAVAVFFLRDGTSMCTSLSCHKKEIEALHERYANNFLYRHFYTARILADRLMGNAFNEYYRKIMIASYLGTDEQQVTWRREQESIKTLAALCAEHGVAFHLVIFPVLFELKDYPYEAVEEVIASFARENHIPIVSLLPGFRGKDESRLWVGPGDQHPNERGHQIASDTLYPYLRSALSMLKPTRAVPARPGTK